jgi:hypothetical protein
MHFEVDRAVRQKNAIENEKKSHWLPMTYCSPFEVSLPFYPENNSMSIIRILNLKCPKSHGGQTLNPAFVSDTEKKSTFKNSRDGDRSDFSMRFG